jgi:hypothetical protein
MNTVVDDTKTADWLDERPYDPDLEKLLEGFEEDPTPNEWWEGELESAPDPDKLQRSLEALVSLGCTKSELLVALQHLKMAYVVESASRSTVLAELGRLERLEINDPVAPDEQFSVADWMQMRELIQRYVEHLRQYAARVKQNPAAERKAALIELLALVQRETHEPQYQLLSELLGSFVDASLTYTNLRQYGSRAGLAKLGAINRELKVPQRRKSRSGRKARLSGRGEAQRTARALAMSGLATEREHHY